MFEQGLGDDNVMEPWCDWEAELARGAGDIALGV